MTPTYTLAEVINQTRPNAPVDLREIFPGRGGHSYDELLSVLRQYFSGYEEQWMSSQGYLFPSRVQIVIIASWVKDVEFRLAYGPFLFPRKTPNSWGVARWEEVVPSDQDIEQSLPRIINIPGLMNYLRNWDRDTDAFERAQQLASYQRPRGLRDIPRIDYSNM